MIFSYLKEHKYFSTTLLGLLLSLANPMLQMIIFIFVSFSALYVLVKNSTGTFDAFKIGTVFGFGYFLGNVYWSAYAPLMTDKPYQWTLSPFGATLFPLYLSIYFGLATGFIRTINTSGFGSALLFALAFTLADICSGKIMGGFSMSTISYMWYYSSEMFQSLSIVGTYGMTFLLVFCGSCLGPYITEKIKSPFFTSVLILITLFCYGHSRLNDNPGTYNKKVYMRILQTGKIKKPFEYSGENSEKDVVSEINEKLLLSNKPSATEITHTIWSESSMPFTVIEGYDVLVRELGKVNSEYLITGGNYLKFNPYKYDEMPEKIYNAMIVIKKNHGVIAHYLKKHLVPFGEILPLRSIIKLFYEDIDAVAGSFDAGDRNEKNLLSVENLPPFIPAICYEIGFKDEIFQKDADWILNITNNSWFGRSPEATLHLTSAVFRSTEFGIPAIISAKSGISAVIDAYGRIKASLPRNYSGVIDTYLPDRSPKKTFYSKYVINIEEYVVYMAVLYLFIHSIIVARRKK